MAQPTGTSPAFARNLRCNKVLHKRVVVLTVVTAQIPHVPDEERLSIPSSDTTCSNVRVQYGFMEDPNVPEALEQACEQVATLRFQPGPRRLAGRSTTNFLLPIA